MAFSEIKSLLDILREQKAMKMKGSIYHKTQIDLTYMRVLNTNPKGRPS